MDNSSHDLKSSNVESVLSEIPGKRSFEYTKLAIFILIILIAVTTLGIFVIDRKDLSKNLNQSINKDKAIPNILYPLHPSKSGREVYYVLNDIQGNNVRFSGVGIKYFNIGDIIPSHGMLTGVKGLIKIASNSAFTNYIVGQFDRWENIPNSPDRYLILKDNLKLRQNGKLIKYPKVRIGFSVLNVDFKNTFATFLGVEDLNSVIPEVRDHHGVKLNIIGLIGKISSQDLNKLIQPNDTIALTFLPDISDMHDLTDSKGVKVAGFIYIRRFNPLQSIVDETGKQLIIKQ